MKSAKALAALLALVSVGADERPQVRFLQPKAPYVLSGPAGTEIEVQAWVEPHAENRVFVLEWCGGRSFRQLDGEEADPVQPFEPLRIRVFPGECELVASVYGSGSRLRARERMTVTVCGGESSC